MYFIAHTFYFRVITAVLWLPVKDSLDFIIGEWDVAVLSTLVCT